MGYKSYRDPVPNLPTSGEHPDRMTEGTNP